MRRVSLLLVFVLTLATPAIANDNENSFIIMSGIPTFCDGGRFLMKVISGRINIICAIPASATITISESTKNMTRIVGVTFLSDGLELLAEQPNK
jgi:hypothetical protein